MSRASLGHRLEFALFRTLRRVLSLVPERIALAGGALLGQVAGSLLRIRRDDVDRHLGWAFPELTPADRARIARTSYRHVGREAVAIFRLGGWTAERVRRRTTVEGLDALRAALEPSCGALVLTGHLGNWEVGGAALASRGLPMDVVAKGMANRRFQDELFAVRARLGMRVVEIRDAPREVLRSLRRGRVAAIVGDQNAHRNAVFVPFFGRAAATARGPALFALRTGVPVFVGFAIRDRGPIQRYTIALEPLPFQPTGDAARDIEAFAAAYMAAVERAVRAHPEQHFWLHKRWKTRPAQEPPSPRQVIP